MRTTVVEGIRFRCPPYLIRAGTGWQLRVPGRASEYFADARHGGTGPAYEAAFIAVKKASKGLKLPPRFARAEIATKKTRTGIPGVSLRKSERGNRIMQYSFAIAVPGLPVRTLYIGTENTAPARYAEKQKEAARIRAAMIRKLMTARD